MSRIYFNSPSGMAELRGSERAHMGILCGNLAMAVFEPDTYGRDELLQRVFPNPYGSSTPYARAFRTAVPVSGYAFELFDGRSVDTSTVALNTALVLGSDAIRLMARLHGQCEIHTWVDGPNREWLATIIEEGRTAAILREDQGWESVVDLLRSRSDQPVVTSFSGSDTFPNPYVAGYREETDSDGWWDLPEEVRWESAMKGLREKGSGLEMRPDEWTFDRFWFDHGDTAFTVLKAAQDANTARPVSVPDISVTITADLAPLHTTLRG